LLSVDTLKAVADTLVLDHLFGGINCCTCFLGLLGHGVLDLEEELDTLDGGHTGLGNGGRDTCDDEVGSEILLGRGFFWGWGWGAHILLLLVSLCV